MILSQSSQRRKIFAPQRDYGQILPATDGRKRIMVENNT